MKGMPIVGLAAVLCVVVARRADNTPAAAGQATQANQSVTRFYGYQVSFQFTQSSRQMAHGTKDQITVIFSSRSVEGPHPPKPFFGDDIMQEFSFSGQDFVDDQLSFTRRVRDKSFVDAPYIRVVNHGSNGWEGGTISLTVDGEQVLRRVPMNPRVGPQKTKGFQLFSPAGWAERSYWEAPLQPFRRLSKSKY